MGREDKSGRGMLLALAAVLVIAVLVYLRMSRSEPAAAPPAPSPRGPSPAASSAAGPGATDFQSLRFNELLQGVLLLARSPHPLTREQAALLADVIRGRRPDQQAGCYVRLVTTGLLDPAQKAFLDKRYEELRADPSHIYRPPGREAQQAYLAALSRRAGGGEVPPLPVPADFICEDVEGAKPVPYTDLLIEFGEDMEKVPDLTLTPEQVQKLLPGFQTYAAITYTEESLILGVLTAEQEAWLSQRTRELRARPAQQREFEQAVIRMAEGK